MNDKTTKILPPYYGEITPEDCWIRLSPSRKPTIWLRLRMWRIFALRYSRSSHLSPISLLYEYLMSCLSAHGNLGWLNPQVLDSRKTAGTSIVSLLTALNDFYVLVPNVLAVPSLTILDFKCSCPAWRVVRDEFLSSVRCFLLKFFFPYQRYAHPPVVISSDLYSSTLQLKAGCMKVTEALLCHGCT